MNRGEEKDRRTFSGATALPGLVPVLGMLLCTFVAFGCASIGAGSSRVLEKGEQEVGFGVELAAGFAKRSPTQRAPFPIPYMSASYRRGLGRRVDVGARTWGMATPGFAAIGASADTKIGFKQVGVEARGWELALDPGAGYHQINIGGAPTHVVLGHLPFLIGYSRGGGDRFVVGPRVDYQMMTGVDIHPVHIVLGGTSIGYSWRITDVVTLRPEFVILYTPLRFNGTLDDPDRRGYTFMSFGVGGFVDAWNL